MMELSDEVVYAPIIANVVLAMGDSAAFPDTAESIKLGEYISDKDDEREVSVHEWLQEKE